VDGARRVREELRWRHLRRRRQAHRKPPRERRRREVLGRALEVLAARAGRVLADRRADGHGQRHRRADAGVERLRARHRSAGKFVYAGSPANAKGVKRSAETEPSMIVISKHSKQAEATYLFLQWIVDKSTQKMLFDKSGGAGVPIRVSTWSLPIVKQSRFAGLYAAMQESLKYGEAKPKAPKLYEIMDVLVGLVQEVGLGKKPAEEALKEGQEKVLAICTKCTL